MGAALDAALERAFRRDAEPIRFIQIGGNDGIHEDPLYEHHQRRTFRFEWGQVFEPIPEYFELLMRNLQPFPYITCHREAVDCRLERGTTEFSYISPADVENHRLPPSSKGIGSLSPGRNALGGFAYPEAKFEMIKHHIRTIQVETIPVEEVTRRYADANFLLTDCEGYDLEIISAAFEAPAFRPKVVQFEHLGPATEPLQKVVSELEQLGYRVARAGKDVIAELS